MWISVLDGFVCDKSIDELRMSIRSRTPAEILKRRKGEVNSKHVDATPSLQSAPYLLDKDTRRGRSRRRSVTIPLDHDSGFMGVAHSVVAFLILSRRSTSAAAVGVSCCFRCAKGSTLTCRGLSRLGHQRVAWMQRAAVAGCSELRRTNNETRRSQPVDYIESGRTERSSEGPDAVMHCAVTST